MVLKEKIKLLNDFDTIGTYSTKEIDMLTKLSYDSNSFIRGLVASLLVKKNDKHSQEILMRLANDKNSYVRMEAYDSLSVFYDKNVLSFLEKRMKTEKDIDALSYSIVSYSEICKVLEENDYGVDLLKNILNYVKSDRCVLSCNYGLYLFGEKTKLDIILSFLHNSNYKIVCFTISLLNEIVNKENSVVIKEAIEKIDLNCVAVKRKIEDIIEVITRANQV